MRKPSRGLWALTSSVVFLGISLAIPGAGHASKKQKSPSVPPDDPTVKLFDLLNNSFKGKLADYYLLADVYEDPASPGKELQHVLRVQYDKNLYFGKFRIYARSLAKPTPDQVKAYTPQQLYDFASESIKFEKIIPGPIGMEGDLYLQSNGNSPLASAPITPEIQATYEKLVKDYLLPALSKEKASG